MEQGDIVIIGAGGFGREVMWHLTEAVRAGKYGFNILGFVDDDAELRGKTVNGFPVVGGVGWLADFPGDISAAVCVGKPKIRKLICEKVKVNPRVSFPTIIAEDVKHSEFIKIGQGSIVCPSSILTVNVTIGDFVVVSVDCAVMHDSQLCDFVTLYPSVNVSGGVRIGAGSEIGTGTNIIQGRTIGENTIVGAGAVVVRNIPSNCTAVGVPARVTRGIAP